MIDRRWLFLFHEPREIDNRQEVGCIERSTCHDRGNRHVVIVLEGARHEILLERDSYREQFWAAFKAFIDADSRWGNAANPLVGPDAIAGAWAPFFAPDGPTIVWRPA